MHDEKLGTFIVVWGSGVEVRAGVQAGVRAVRALRAGCCVASAGVLLFVLTGWGGLYGSDFCVLRGWGGVEESICSR